MGSNDNSQSANEQFPNRNPQGIIRDIHKPCMSLLIKKVGENTTIEKKFALTYNTTENYNNIQEINRILRNNKDSIDEATFKIFNDEGAETYKYKYNKTLINAQEDFMTEVAQALQNYETDILYKNDNSKNRKNPNQKSNNSTFELSVLKEENKFLIFAIGAVILGITAAIIGFGITIGGPGYIAFLNATGIPSYAIGVAGSALAGCSLGAIARTFFSKNDGAEKEPSSAIEMTNLVDNPKTFTKSK